MARATVRPALAKLPSSLQAADGSPLFASVWDRLPPRIDRSLWPACVVMVPEGQNKREGMRMKIDYYGCQLWLFFALPSVGWPSMATGTGGNAFLAPATEPQVLFDELIDQLIVGLVANQAFTQNVPGGNRSTIQLGQKITTRHPSPKHIEQSVGLAAFVEFEVTELTVGV